MSDHVSEPVKRNSEASRYEVQVDGNLAGVVEYDEHDGRIDMTHTEVSGDFRGSGIGETLAGSAIIDAVDRGLVIVPSCPFIESYLRKHPIAGAQVEWPHRG
ncbi:GNAT family N-acetyltransferase [Demequina oxidasica]|uniref:GNAT family N-acetyltransferase n=1 Tax=Demequina oxidasica TaxID=676199 RepID=UPI000780E3DA|nr:GNAT family N-acetyltransferase [Demequina oxidasica]